MITKDDFDRLSTFVVNALRGAMIEEVRREVERESLAYRKATCVRDQWCCTEMRAFALKVWSAAAPKMSEPFYGVTYNLRGHVVNFCPFCGAALGKRDA
jgi:hypothetical protein